MEKIYYAQGDLIIKPAKIPAEVKEKKDGIIAEGEASGHLHRLSPRQVKSGDAILFVSPQGMMFVRVKSQEAIIEHDSHADIVLPQGDYEVGKQIEWDQIAGIRKVMD